MTFANAHERWRVPAFMIEIARTLFHSLPDVRYVATSIDGRLELNQRPGITHASDSESDKYEELIVNPTLLELLERRGNIDCGGMDYVIIRYGHFFEFVQSIPAGHISVGIEPDAHFATVVEQIRAHVADWLDADRMPEVMRLTAG
jgi:hypothetical protein